MVGKAATPELFPEASAPLADAVRRDPGKITREYAAAYFYEKLGGAARYREPVIADFARRRKTRKIAPALLVREVNFWLGYPQNMVLEAVRIWREQRCAEEGLDERYFRGILRTLKKSAEARRRRPQGGTICRI
jgi:hypothetical protein